MPPLRLILVSLVLVACTSASVTGPLDGGPPAFAGSGLGPDEIPLVVDQRCPGDPACPDTGDTRLYVGAAKRDVTPTIEPFVDLNHNGLYDFEEPFTDRNGNGRFDPVWLAGRDNGTLAIAVHDPVWVRCYVLRQDHTTVAHCVVDGIGYMKPEADQIRADLDPGLGVDLVMVGATHDHQNHDLVGMWGPTVTTTGYWPEYMAFVRRSFVAAIAEAVGALKPAKMSIGAIKTQDPPDARNATGDMTAYVGDSRDPVVIDPTLHLLQFDSEVDGKPIVTVVNWGSHPDSLGSDRHEVSSDWVHYFRERLALGTGSDVVYVQGECGGQVGPGGVTPWNADRSARLPHEESYRFIEAWGNELADVALLAFGKRSPVTSPRLAFRHTTLDVHIENTLYQTAHALGLFHREEFGYDPKLPQLRTPELDNEPLTRTEVAYLTLGPASIITCPGELLPENFLGGYDGSYAGTYRFIDTMAPNAPDPSRAPVAPYLSDLMGGAPEHRMVFGLTLDMLGYMVPRYNFVVDVDSPYLVGARGDHYEETNSIGPRAEPEIVGTMRQLVMSKAAAP